MKRTHQNILAAVLFTAVAILPTASKAATGKVEMCKAVGQFAASTYHALGNMSLEDLTEAVEMGEDSLRVARDADRQPEVSISDFPYEMAGFALKWMGECIDSPEEFSRY